MVLEEIHKLISQGKLQPGDNLPSEMELAERFGVGRSSIREAMRVLQLMGVVEVMQGKGTFVREPGILPLVIDWSRTKTGLTPEVMEARQFMEVLLARLAAERATEEDVDALRLAVRRSEESLSNGENPSGMETNVRAGVDFHLALADAAHNQVLSLMYRTIRGLYLDLARRTRITPEVARDRNHDHQCLLEAVIARDPARAAAFMQGHIDKANHILSARGAEHDE